MIELRSPIRRTARVMQLEGMFDLAAASESVVTIDALPVERLDEHDWSIGLIVGPSGAGKSSVARAAFGDLVDPELQWASDAAAIDAFPQSMGMSDVTDLLSSVGFSSPPAWRRPYHVLSNGERFRVTMARLLAETTDRTLVVDEFSSVVDRTVAQIGSAAIARTVRKRGQRFVAVTCHYDVEDWLQPDWTYQPHTGEFVWRSLQPRPGIVLDVVRCTHEAWRVFAPHHYMSAELNRSARMIVATTLDGQPVALAAVLGFPHRSWPHAVRVSRLVVLPDYQGVGIAGRLLDLVVAAYATRDTHTFITSSHPGIVHSLNRSPRWVMNGKPHRSGSDVGRGRSLARTRSKARLVSGFRYAGPADDTLRALVL